MDDPRFWEIIESGGRKALDDPERQLAAVRKRLVRLSPEELVDFHRHFLGKMDEAYSWDLWGAAYLINGGCSDDGFAYFRAWLISRGQAVYAAAVSDPDSLAGVAEPDRDDYEFEDLWGLALEVYEAKAGAPMPEVPLDASPEPIGTRWDFDDDEQVSRRLPRLAALYV